MNAPSSAEPTPRTDSFFGAGDGILCNGIQYVPASFARELERALRAGHPATVASSDDPVILHRYTCKGCGTRIEVYGLASWADRIDTTACGECRATNLLRAAALIAAEIERLDRMNATDSTRTPAAPERLDSQTETKEQP